MIPTMPRRNGVSILASAPLASEHDACAEMDYSDSPIRRRLGSGFPVAASVSQKTCAGGDYPHSNADRNDRRRSRLPRQTPGFLVVPSAWPEFPPATEFLPRGSRESRLFRCRRPASGRDVFTSEVDRCVNAFEAPSAQLPGHRIPSDGPAPEPEERTRRTTSCPPDCNAGTRAEPTRPVEPEIRIFIALPPDWRYLRRGQSAVRIVTQRRSSATEMPVRSL